MLKRGIVNLAVCLILMVLVSGIGFAQENEATPTPTESPSESPSATPSVEESPAESPSPADDEDKDEEEEEDEGSEKVKICHIPPGNPENAHTIDIDSSSVEEHLAHGDYEGECDDEDINVEEELGGAGVTSGFLHGIDVAIDRILSSDLENRNERIAEIKALVEEGRIEEAKELLKLYEEFADNLEREVSPEEREKVKRSSRAIRKVIRSIEKDISDEERDEFSDVIDKENKIEAAVEIASKIKDLCEQLAKLDPNEYERVCKVKGDAPRWQRELDDDLTEEQKDAARKFAEVMGQCFRTQGRECTCSELEEINKPFADRCSIVAPLAAKCDKGDESACEAMDDVTEGIEELLPDYLLDIFAELEGDIAEDQFEFHMPIECREARAKTPKACMETMFRENAPGPCLNALDRGEISFDNEREAREACENIMFNEYAPPECIEAGLRNPRECGTFMFEQNAPQECIDAGLTGENKDDPRKCERLMREQFGEGPGGGRGHGPGPDCRRIENSEERLKCYDGALEGIGGPEGPAGFGGREGRGHFPRPCEEAKAFTRESCEKIMIESSKKRFEETKRYEESFASECRAKDGRWDCSFGDVTPGEPCRCFFDEEERFRREREDRSYKDEYEDRYRDFRPPEGEFREGEGFRPPEGFHPPEGFVPPEGFQPPQFGPPEGFVPPEGFRPPEGFQPPTTESGTSSTTTTESSGTSGTSESSGASGSGESSGGSGGGETSGGTTGTGSVIAVDSDNKFVDYYYWG